ncbi:MAG: glutathione peroxidase [Phycisphaerales bacterium]|nr:glutathione peroxidase [Phycisphaerales bacterium]
MHRIDGAEEPLEAYRGRVVMVVNVASACGLTPQYEGLEALYEQHAGDGLVILGFPANNFGGQEPGSDSEISSFCTQNYGVTFPMFSKISVKGKDIDPLYETLTSMPAPIGGEVQWNFQKYVVNRQGEVVAKFSPRTKPDDPALVALIDGLLEDPKD